VHFGQGGFFTETKAFTRKLMLIEMMEEKEDGSIQTVFYCASIDRDLEYLAYDQLALLHCCLLA
jgi:hypothetical protein